MKLLATLKDKDIFPNREIKDNDKWQLRKTVKIIALNKNNQIALITNPIHGFYLLPGGGIEEGEEIEMAANRECEEEIGYSVDNQIIIGKTKEFRDRESKEYDTYCVSAKITKPVDQDKRTKNEKKLGLNVEWFDIDKALKTLKEQGEKLKSGKVEFYNTGFNIVRDRIFVEYFIKDYK
ncbi:NUDIX domain-containing protein [Patescibacteria group bacterium]|nr:NUDIX domain-containing protein [Patescibacteria group bacterium]MBU4313257.1 NUDIX domain-containing protein [Actinomycetota bacterium]MBU4493287.1 NUDIX domain-containing protein [Nanoarchaeota archaeon]